MVNILIKLKFILFKFLLKISENCVIKLMRVRINTYERDLPFVFIHIKNIIGKFKYIFVFFYFNFISLLLNFLLFLKMIVSGSIRVIFMLFFFFFEYILFMIFFILAFINGKN